MTEKVLVGIIMGSQSDWETMKHAADVLERLGVTHETQVVSAHRTPDRMFEYAEQAADRGLQVVGIALDDAERAAAFAAGLDLAYPVLVGDTDVVMTGQRYGNRGGMLPFTVLIDARGIVRWTHLGALEVEAVAEQIAALD